jgi:hypothetical protein
VSSSGARRHVPETILKELDTFTGGQPEATEQTRASASPASKILAPSGLRAIVTRYSAHFEELHETVKTQCYGADPEL